MQMSVVLGITTDKSSSGLITDVLANSKMSEMVDKSRLLFFVT